MTRSIAPQLALLATLAVALSACQPDADLPGPAVASDATPQDAPQDAPVGAPEGAVEGAGPQEDPRAQWQPPAELDEAMAHPDLTGSFVLQLVAVPPLLQDRCTGQARAIRHEDGSLEGLAHCNFEVAADRLGSTSGHFVMPAGQTTGTFDASPAPIVAPLDRTDQEGTDLDGTDQKGTITLSFAIFVEISPGEVAAVSATIQLSPST